MLQAYVDESISTDGRGRLFVMAGYIASPDKWKAFSDEWSSLLGMRSPHFRRLDEFKMADLVQSPVGIKQAELFYRVIERHLETSIACVVRLDDVLQAYSKVAWPSWVSGGDRITNEYFVGFDQIIRGLAAHQSVIGIDGPVDFVFDDHSSKAKCVDAWAILKGLAPPMMRRLLGDTPRFHNSQTSMPLQAADLLAYWLRESEERLARGEEYKLAFPWERRKEMNGMILYMTEEMIGKHLRDALLAMQLFRAGIRREQLESILQFMPLQGSGR